MRPRTSRPKTSRNSCAAYRWGEQPSRPRWPTSLPSWPAPTRGSSPGWFSLSTADCAPAAASRPIDDRRTGAVPEESGTRPPNQPVRRTRARRRQELTSLSNAALLRRSPTRRKACGVTQAGADELGVVRPRAGLVNDRELALRLVQHVAQAGEAPDALLACLREHLLLGETAEVQLAAAQPTVVDQHPDPMVHRSGEPAVAPAVCPQRVRTQGG